MRAALEKINGGIYAVERAIVVTSLLLMSVIVFFDVVHRRYTAEEGKLMALIGRILGLDPEGEGWQGLMAASPWVTAFLLFVLVFVGILTASTRSLIPGQDSERAERPERRPSAVLAAVYAAGVILLCWLALRIAFGSGSEDTEGCLASGYSWDCGVFPSGLIWSQPMALVLTAWVGFLGASMATSDNRQLKVEAALRYYPEKVRRGVALLSSVLTAVFCLFLAYMSSKLIADLYNDYVATDGLGGVFDGVSIPRYLGFIVLPLGYILMAARFVGNGVLAFRGELAEGLGELGDRDLDAIAAELAAEEEGR